MLKWAIVTLVVGTLLGIFLVACILLIYREGESESSKKRLAVCELGELAVALNREFHTTGMYPAQLADSTEIGRLSRQGIVCSGPLRGSDGNFLDPWGELYVLERQNVNHAVIFSRHALNIGLPLDWPLHLIDGIVVWGTLDHDSVSRSKDEVKSQLRDQFPVSCPHCPNSENLGQSGN